MSRWAWSLSTYQVMLCVSAHLEPLLSRWRELAGPAFDERLIADTGEFASMELVLNSNTSWRGELPRVLPPALRPPHLNTYRPLMRTTT